MRGSLLPWFFVGSVLVAGSFAACGGDDSAAPEDAGNDAGAHDARPNDATSDDASIVDAGADVECNSCGGYIGNGLNPILLPACPGSIALYEALIDCVCNVDVITNEAGAGKCDIDSGTGDAGEGACKDVCPAAGRTLTPTNACVNCELDACRLTFLACFDDGLDSGPDGG